MIKINNSFNDFTHEYQTLKKPMNQSFEQPITTASELDRFIKTSQFVSKVNPQTKYRITVGENSALKPSHYFKCQQSRFQGDNNCNMLMFGEVGSGLKTDSFVKYKVQLKSALKPIYINKEDIEYKQTTQAGIQQAKQQQLRFKAEQSEFHRLNRQHRLADNLHRDYSTHQNTQRKDYYWIHKNTNESVEFHNNDIPPKNDLYYELSTDWMNKRQNRKLDESSYDRIMSQESKQCNKQNLLRLRNLIQNDTRGKEYNAIQFTKILD